MEEESNKINWASGSDNSPYVSKKYRKSTVVIVFWVIIFVFFGLVLLTGLSDKSTYSDDAGIATIWFLTILKIIFLFKIFGAYLTTLTVGAESLIYKKGVLFRRKSEISYIQISYGGYIA